MSIGGPHEVLPSHDHMTEPMTGVLNLHEERKWQRHRNGRRLNGIVAG